MGERLNLDGKTLNFDGGTLTLDGETRPPASTLQFKYWLQHISRRVETTQQVISNDKVC